MLRLLGQIYRDAFRFMVALPLIAAIPIAAEALQHIAEYRIGMFESLAAMEAGADHPARMVFGYFKVLTLFLLGYWVTRFLGFGGDRAAAIAMPRRAVTLYAFVLVFDIALGLLNLAGGSALAGAVTSPGALLAVGVVAFLAITAFTLCFTPWKAGAALGNARLGIPASFRIMRGNILWSLVFTIASMLPLMIAHYALGILPAGQPGWLVATMLALDSLLVGYLGALLVASQFRVAERAASRAGVALTAQEDERRPLSPA